jgi:hypothetical protein
MRRSGFSLQASVGEKRKEEERRRRLRAEIQVERCRLRSVKDGKVTGTRI